LKIIPTAVYRYFTYLFTIIYYFDSTKYSSPLSITSIGHEADPGFLRVSPQVALVIIGYHYFLPRPRLLSQPEITSIGRYQIILLGNRGTQV